MQLDDRIMDLCDDVELHTNLDALFESQAEGPGAEIVEKRRRLELLAARIYAFYGSGEKAVDARASAMLHLIER